MAEKGVYSTYRIVKSRDVLEPIHGKFLTRELIRFGIYAYF